MTRILTSDILIADIITHSASLQPLIDKYKLEPKGKRALTREQFDEFSEAMQGKPMTIMPGGSSANTLTTLGKLLGDRADTTFLGVTGGGMYSHMIRHSLEESGIKLMPDPTELPKETPPESAVSYVATYPNGERSIVTYPGNAKQLLKSEMITDDLVKNHDVLFLQGSLLEKLDPELGNAMLKKRWSYDKELWLALPTQAKFGTEKASHFQWLVPSADVILSNETELMRTYETNDLDMALRRLQKTFAEHPVKQREGKHLRREPVGFITNGDQGAFIVTAHSIEKIDPQPIRPDQIVNTLGAGDTAFAGFAAGHLAGLPLRTSAQISMALASEKLKVNGPRLPDPMKALKAASPRLAQELERKIAEMPREGMPQRKAAAGERRER